VLESAVILPISWREGIDFAVVITMVDLRIAFSTKYPARQSRNQSGDENSTTMVPAWPRTASKGETQSHHGGTKDTKVFVGCAVQRSPHSPDEAQRIRAVSAGKFFADRANSLCALAAFVGRIAWQKSLLRNGGPSIFLGINSVERSGPGKRLELQDASLCSA
jgi:hypothetical protein